MLYGHLAHLIETPKSNQPIVTPSDRHTIRPICSDNIYSKQVCEQHQPATATWGRLHGPPHSLSPYRSTHRRSHPRHTCLSQLSLLLPSSGAAPLICIAGLHREDSHFFPYLPLPNALARPAETYCSTATATSTTVLQRTYSSGGIYNWHRLSRQATLSASSIIEYTGNPILAGRGETTDTAGSETIQHDTTNRRIPDFAFTVGKISSHHQRHTDSQTVIRPSTRGWQGLSILSCQPTCRTTERQPTQLTPLSDRHGRHTVPASHRET